MSCKECKYKEMDFKSDSNSIVYCYKCIKKGFYADTVQEMEQTKKENKYKCK